MALAAPHHDLDETTLPDVTGRLRDAVALVVGAGSIGSRPGNGAATAILFARAGARVFCVDRDPDALRRTVATIRAEGGEAAGAVADVQVEEQVRAAVEECAATFGGVDVLHNNVGIGVPGALADVQERHWDLVMDVNLTGTFLACKHAIPHLLRSTRGGAIVNVSSIASQVTSGVPLIAYGASKAGVDHLTRVVAAQYGATGLRCNAVLPGLIDSPTVYAGLTTDEAEAERMRERRHRMAPSGRMGQVWDVAYASLFLASEDASYITGVLLPVDAAITTQVVAPTWDDV
ncbi:SDR family NAD(P)-dependent oxidoreductase [Nocardioides humi]|uniref:Glucose 1-dehydrogenase n=1 Tax=Nocardioides humi TaxID=449461 RepID=A0ABN2BSP1_9ACTN|nr:SDR family oxidoreductase [Nocardioides humi]